MQEFLIEQLLGDKRAYLGLEVDYFPEDVENIKRRLIENHGIKVGKNKLTEKYVNAVMEEIDNMFKERV